MTKNKKQFLGLLVFLVSFLFVIPTVFGESESDKFGYATFNFTYEQPWDNPNFPHFIYNIEYVMDGVVGYTERDSISFPIHDMRNHTFQVYFGGEVFEYIWKGDIIETIILPTKSIQSQVYYKNMTLATNVAVNLWLYNGITMYMVIVRTFTDENGSVSIDNLIMGKYILRQTNVKLYMATTFLLEQEVIIYENNILI